ncbi:hypothetical protein DFH09DRAFT_1035763 [Mycena vulgaris]|nr:hypothetical protein DFH09DRAFT_1035763 [Mycena vulgaris]
MSTPTAPPNGIPLPPPGTNWLAVIQPSMAFLMIGTVFSSLLIPMLVALLFFSTSDSRRLVIFNLNVLAIVMGIFTGAINGYCEIHNILSPLNPVSSSLFDAYAFMSFFLPFIVESILVLRLLAVYPYSTTPIRKFILVFTFPVIVKLVRIINLAVFMRKYVILTRTVASPLVAGDVFHQVAPKIEWTSQLLDNAYSSSIFIQRLQIYQSGSVINRLRASGKFSDRLRALFLISLSNFVFPCLLSLAQLILLFRDPNYLPSLWVAQVNGYVNIIFVVFATVWASGTNWSDPKTTGSAISSINFRPRPGRGTNFDGQDRSTVVGSQDNSKGQNTRAAHSSPEVNVPLRVFAQREQIGSVAGMDDEFSMAEDAKNIHNDPV